MPWPYFENYVRTPRSRTQSYVGTVQGNTSLVNPTPEGGPGLDDGSGGDEGNPSGATDAWEVRAPWDPPPGSGPPTIKVDRDLSGYPGTATYGYYGSHITVQTGGSAAVQAWDATAMPSTRNFSYPYTGTFGFTIQSEEWTLLHVEDETEAVYIDGVGFPITAGAAQPDGPFGLKRYYVEFGAAGALTAYCTINGVTASVSRPVGAGEVVVLYDVHFAATGNAVNASEGFALTLSWNSGKGGNPQTPPYSYSGPSDNGGQAALSVTPNGSGFTINGSASGSGVGKGGTWLVEGYVGQPIRRRYRHKVTAWDQPHPGGLSVAYPTGSVAVGGGDYLQVIRRYGLHAVLNGVDQGVVSSPDAYTPAYARLTGMADASDDTGAKDRDARQDGRIDVLTVPWTAGTISHAASFPALSASSWDRTTLTPANPTATATLSGSSRWEAYRFARVALTGHGVVGRTVGVTVANSRFSRTYSTATGDDGSLKEAELDGCAPTNAPGGFDFDRRRGMFPTVPQYSLSQSPIAKPVEERVSMVNPKEGADEPEDADAGWLMGWNEVETVTLTVLFEPGDDSASVEVGGMELFRKGDPRLTLLDSFKCGTDEGNYGSDFSGYERQWDYKGRDSESAAVIGTVYGGPFLTMEVDGRICFDLPGMVRDVPADGDPSFTYYTVSDLLQMLPAFAGVTVSLASSFPVGYVGDDALALFLGGSGWLYPYGGSDGMADFAASIERPVGAVVAQERVDQVYDYPGCGNVCGAGDYGVDTVYAVAKVVRSRDEGIVLDPTTRAPVSGASVGTVDDVSGAMSGTGTTDAVGYYRTGLPYGRGPKSHTTAYAGVSDSVLWRNRRRERHSFLHVGSRGGSVHLDDNLVTGFFLETRSDETMVKTTAFDVHGQSFAGTVGVGSQGKGYWHPSGGAYVYRKRGDSVVESRSGSQGQDWTDQDAMIPGSQPTPEVHDLTGNEYVATWQAGTWRLNRRLAGETSFTDAGPIVAGPETGAGLRCSPTLDGDLVFSYFDGTQTKRRASRSQGDDWADLPT